MVDPADAFIKTAGVVSGLCVGIIILTLFFTALNFLKGKLAGDKVVKMQTFIQDATLVNVHLVGGNSLERMRFIGFTNRGSVKGNVPFQLTNMVVLESEQGLRTLIRADSIKMIQEIGNP
jgi:hypothetical protein